jgi:hypothetical protein
MAHSYREVGRKQLIRNKEKKTLVISCGESTLSSMEGSALRIFMGWSRCKQKDIFYLVLS